MDEIVFESASADAIVRARGAVGQVEGRFGDLEDRLRGNSSEKLRGRRGRELPLRPRLSCPGFALERRNNRDKRLTQRGVINDNALTTTRRPRRDTSC